MNRCTERHPFIRLNRRGYLRCQSVRGHEGNHYAQGTHWADPFILDERYADSERHCEARVGARIIRAEIKRPGELIDRAGNLAFEREAAAYTRECRVTMHRLAAQPTTYPQNEKLGRQA